MKTCSIEGCDSPHLAKTFCRKHYLRDYKYGDPNTVFIPQDFVPSGKYSTNFVHGLWNHPLYKTWSNMHHRCYNPKDNRYARYGGRGISVCDHWHEIANFIKDMGDKPVGYSIDRINVDGNYTPSNCQWANDTTQSRNRSFTKLSLDKAREIRSMKADGFTKPQMAKKFLVSVASIKKVLSGEYWTESGRSWEKVRGAAK